MPQLRIHTVQMFSDLSCHVLKDFFLQFLCCNTSSCINLDGLKADNVKLNRVRAHLNFTSC